MSGVVVDCFDLRKSAEMVLFCVHRLVCRIRRRVADPDAVLDEPSVDGFSRMCHKDAAFEICLGQDVRQRSSVVDVKTASR